MDVSSSLNSLKYLLKGLEDVFFLTSFFFCQVVHFLFVLVFIFHLDDLLWLEALTRHVRLVDFELHYHVMWVCHLSENHDVSHCRSFRLLTLPTGQSFCVLFEWGNPGGASKPSASKMHEFTWACCLRDGQRILHLETSGLNSHCCPLLGLPVLLWNPFELCCLKVLTVRNIFLSPWPHPVIDSFTIQVGQSTWNDFYIWIGKLCLSDGTGSSIQETSLFTWKPWQSSYFSKFQVAVPANWN